MWVEAEAEDGIRDRTVTGVQTCALPIFGLGQSLQGRTVSTRQKNERKYERWEDLPGGGRRYSFDVPGRQRGKARYVKEVDAQEVMVKFWRSEERRVGKECRCGWRRKQKTAYEIVR